MADYRSHTSQVYRIPRVLTDVPVYPNAHVALNEGFVYKDDEEPRYRYHHHHHHHPEERERVEVVEYERADNYGNTEVVYEQNVDVDADRYGHPRRNNLYEWKTFRQ